MRIKANTIEINYELSGKKGAPVVVLSIPWRPARDVESSDGCFEPYFQVLRYDMRGHGKTEVISGPYTLDLLADDVIGLLDALKSTGSTMSGCPSEE